jgi:Bcr/CflA subfamily drug resistance transporter
MIGLCFSQLIYGPLSDYYGRRNVILFGYVIFTLGCVMVTVAHSIEMLLFGRVVQALGIGASGALFRAIMRDVFAGNQLAKIGSYLGTVFSIVPPLAPITGGYIQAAYGWRANFLISLILSVVLGTLLAIFLPETLAPSHRRKRSLSEVFRMYKEFLTHRQFLGFTACSSLAFANLVAYITISPFLFQHTIGLTPIQYGWLAPLTALSYILGTLLNVKLLNYYSSHYLLHKAGFVMFAGAFIMLIFACLGVLNIWVVLLPLMLTVVANGLVFTNAFAGAFEPFPHAAGMAGAMYASLQMLAAGLASTIAALLPGQTQMGLAIMLTLMSSSVIIIIRWGLRIK